MTPEFGKALRKVRVDLDLTLADLARRLELSAAYLSCLETGKKPVPPSFVDTLIEALELQEPEASKLRETAVLTRSKAVLICLEGRDPVAKKLAVAFARRLDGPMTGSQAQALLQLLEPQKKVKAHDSVLHRSARAK